MIETLDLLYIDLYTKLYAPRLFATLDNKNQIIYEIIFKEIREILTNDNKFPLAFQTYTIDYELALENV